MRVCVFGATGLIGRHIVEALVSAGDIPVVATFRSRPAFQAANVHWVHCDLRDRAPATRALEGCDTAVVCAGRVSTSAVLRANPVEPVLDTLRILTNAMEAASLAGLDKVVLISSCTGYPNSSRALVEGDFADGEPPLQWSGVGWMHRYIEKQLAWYVNALQKVRSAVILRPALVYGAHDDFDPKTGHFVPAFVRQVVERQNPLRLFGDGQQRRNLLHASDLATAVMACLRIDGPPLNIFNVASPEDVTVESVLKQLLDLDGFVDAEIVYDRSVAEGTNALAIDATRLATTIGWRPSTDLRTGLASVLSWYRNARA